MVLWTRLIVRLVPQNRMVTKGYWRVVYDRVTHGSFGYEDAANRKQRKECPANPRNFSNTLMTSGRKPFHPRDFESGSEHPRQSQSSPYHPERSRRSQSERLRSRRTPTSSTNSPTLGFSTNHSGISPQAPKERPSLAQDEVLGKRDI